MFDESVSTSPLYHHIHMTHHHDIYIYIIYIYTHYIITEWLVGFTCSPFLLLKSFIFSTNLSYLHGHGWSSHCAMRPALWHVHRTWTKRTWRSSQVLQNSKMMINYDKLWYTAWWAVKQQCVIINLLICGC